MTRLLTAESVQSFLPARPTDGHKGRFGRLLIVGGCAYYPGAPWLAASAALRSGTGLVRVAAGRSTLASPNRPLEVILLPLPETGMGMLIPEGDEELEKHLSSQQALILGPGMSTDEAPQALLRRILGLEAQKPKGRVGFFGSESSSAAPTPATASLPPTVLDADALNLLAQSEEWASHLAHGQFVLTPHPGEMARLLGVEQLEGDPVPIATEAAVRWGQIVVLKGATTVVAAPDETSFLLDQPNPALATAGSGDVLAGIIGGLLAQGCAPFAAASLGVYLHSAAGQLVRAQIGEQGAIASDQIAALPTAIRQLRQGV